MKFFIKTAEGFFFPLFFYAVLYHIIPGFGISHTNGLVEGDEARNDGNDQGNDKQIA